MNTPTPVPGWKRRWFRLEQAARKEIADILNKLPLPLRAHARDLPVVFESEPSDDLIEGNIDKDTLGLFVGPTFADSQSGMEDVPSQIFLFLDNIWEYAGHDTPTYREEVRKTYLHELGHYLGLDEDDLMVRDLE
jgi:predicted Zn-dependent protease with MMP-like domain